ncbi:MAG: C40 family peptidase [Nitrospirae bacterium]|nr:C40 family peptidase [Nitrospirota bacterium]
MAKIVYLTISFLLLFVFSTNVNAQKHKVKTGETLYDIAKDNGVSVKDIKNTNKLHTSRIHPGDVIAIPGKAALKTKDKQNTLAKATIKKTTKSNDVTEVKAADDYNPYIVESGENLYRIASRFGISVKEIKKINNLKGNAIKVGQKLLVPVVEHEEELPDTADESVKETDVAAADSVEEFQNEDENALNNVLARNNIDALTEDSDSSNWFSLIDKAMDYIGVPYRFGGSSLKGIDCSAFVQTVYKYFSIDLPRTAREQFKAGVRVSKKEQLRIGDLIFFRTYAKYPSHVGIYVGEGKMIHASSRNKKVTISSINEPYYIRRYIGAVRLPENLPNMNVEDLKSFAN